MKRLLAGAIALSSVLILALLTSPFLVDWNAKKDHVTDAVRALTGRDVAIAGDVDLALLPSPVLTADAVSLQVPPERGRPDPAGTGTADLDQLKLRVAFWPLLTGQVEIEDIVFVRPTVRVDLLPDGRLDWGFAEGGLGETESSSARQAWLAERLRRGGYAIEDGTLIYRDVESGGEQRIEGIHATVAADQASGRLVIDGRASLHGQAGAFEVSLAHFDAAGIAGLEADFALPEAGARGRFAGTLRRSPTDFALSGRVTGEGESLTALVPLAAQLGLELAEDPGDSFAFEADLAVDQERVALSALDVRLGDDRLKGAVSAELREPLKLDARLAVSALDLDRLLASDRAGIPLPTALPDGLAADLDLRVVRLRYRGADSQDVHLVASLADGAATLHKLAATVPGDAWVSLSGQLAGDAAEPRFTGFLTAAAEDLPATLAWLGVERDGALVAPLGALELSSEIDLAPQSIALRQLDLSTREGRAQGGLVLSLKDTGRPALGLGLLVDRLDLTPILAAEGETGSGWARLRGLLSDVDANLDLRIGTLVHPDLTVAEARLLGTLVEGVVHLEEASGRDPAGNRLRYAGEVSGLAGSPAFAGALALEVRDPVPLAGLAGLDPAPLARIAPFSLEGDLVAALSELTFAVRVAALDGRFALNGSLSHAEPLARFALNLEAEHKSLAKLVNRLADRRVLGDGLGRLAAQARLEGTAEAFEVSTLTGTVGPARVEGGFAVDLTGARPAVGALDLAVAARHANLSHFLTALSLPSPIRPALGGLDLAGKVAGDGQTLRLTGLTGRVGPVALSGAMTARLAGGGVALGDLDLAVKVRHPSAADLLSALALEPPFTPAFGAVNLTGRVSGAPADLRVSGLSGRLGPFALDGALTADLTGPVPAATEVAIDLAVAHPSLAQLAASLGRPGSVPESFGGIELRGALAGDRQRIEVRDLAGTIGPGSLDGTLVADLTGSKPKLDLDLTTGPLPLAALLAPAGGDGPAQPWSQAALDLSPLRSFDADLQVSSTAWFYGDTRLEGPSLRATLRGGVLNLNRLSGQLYGGTLQVAGKVKAGRAVNLGVTLDADGLELARILSQHLDFDRVAGPVTLKASLISEGESPAQLIAGLTGRGTLTGQLNVAAREQEAASTALLALLGGPKAGPSGVIDPTHTLLNAFASEPIALNGTFAVTGGVLRSDNTRIEGAGAYALSRAQLDLGAWRMDTKVDVYRRDNLRDSYLTVQLLGPMAEPRTRFRSQRAAALLGSGHGSMAERIHQLRGMLGEVVDFAPMARYVLGRHTESITPHQWSRFLAQYEKLFVSGYELPSGGSWSGDWKIQDIRPLGEDQLITVAFQTKSGGYAKVGFRVRESEEALFGFKIVDAISEGISFLVTQRSEFSSILRTQGIEGLIDTLEREFSDRPAAPDLPEVQDWEALRFIPHKAR